MPTKREILRLLKRDELLDAVDLYSLEVSDRRVRDFLIEALASTRRARLDEILAGYSRNRLKELCRDLGFDDSGRAKADIVARLIGRGTPESALAPPSRVPRKREVLEQLRHDELLYAVDLYGLEVPDRRVRADLVGALVRHGRLDEILADFYRDRLKEICRGLHLDDSGRAKADIIERLTGSPADKPAEISAEPDDPPSAAAELSIVDDEPQAAIEMEGEPSETLDEAPSIPGLLNVLTRARLVSIGREVGVAVPVSASRAVQGAALAYSGGFTFRELLRFLSRDELKANCAFYGLDFSGRSRAALAQRLLEAHGGDDGTEPHGDMSLFSADERTARHMPSRGDIVQVRHRQYLVEDVIASETDSTADVTAPVLDATIVRLVCLDDDNQGQRLDVLWELELGARVLQPQTHGLGDVERLDEPRSFAAYLNAVKWNAVTATEARLFQAPFRAGIQLMNHQLPPLRKALELPRANLFIADDVGLGKTIEAGLILQELQLRQRVDFVLIVCPAAICLQWRDEMARRFGLRFELYNRAFVGRRRQERGFQVNPWDTHNRFIISYQTLRRPEYREPLLRHLGDRTRKSLLLLDEAHTVAPASASKYAIDSRLTRVIRDVAPRFENRLFLSATPHNGHSNSFSALLELLDPQRFTRGVPVEPRERDKVMVRRLKADLRRLGSKYPDRKVVRIELRPDSSAPELRLSVLLQQYTDLMKPTRGRGQLVFINLQKRLLSSIEAFWRTLGVHARHLGEGSQQAALRLPLPVDDDEYGMDDEALEVAGDATAEASSRLVKTPEQKARELLDEMTSLAEQSRLAPDAKVLAFIDWMRRHQCPSVRIGGATGGEWTDVRVILFTEYGDTKRYLYQLLSAAVDGTDRGDERIMQFHGGMSDDQRGEVQNAFNAPPEEHPVRILIATDAAREGINLQAHCADLFHFDVPWNPARLEQRNGRIDRTLQPAAEVRCHYFVYSQRSEDLVLEKLVHKVDTILDELGSLGTVIMERYAGVMDKGIGETTGDELDRAERLEGKKETTKDELEGVRDDLEALRRENDQAGRILSRSRNVLGFDSDLLRDAVDVGLELAGAGRMMPADTPREGGNGGPSGFTLPDLPAAWTETLDSLRPPRERDEAFWEWRRKAPLPVVFEPLVRVTNAQVHLHLQHPFIERILSRFLAQGYSAQDLARVTVIRDTTEDIVRAIAFGRLSLFGPGATRLHDELVPVMAPWYETGRNPPQPPFPKGGSKTTRTSKGDFLDHLEPFSDVTDRQLFRELTQLLAKAPQLDDVPAAARKRLQNCAPEVFVALWPHISDEAESRAHEAERKLRERGSTESVALRKILLAQRGKIRDTLGERSQLQIVFGDKEVAQQEQFEQDKKHMERRLTAIDNEIETEPQQIEELYQVAVRRLEPVGLVFLWPATRG